ncbi:hypothetical protein B0H19DRAFT_1173358 [Mycena capillaripes]|nr:hypothetical protein B0H19DRAFT_1173358 [Mycena capillaripes]
MLYPSLRALPCHHLGLWATQTLWAYIFHQATRTALSKPCPSSCILQAFFKPFFSSRLQSFKTGAIKSSRLFSRLQARRLMLISHQVAAKSSRASGVCNPRI